jgi:hypothetical protein
MQRKQERVSAGISFVVILILASAIALEQGMTDSPKWYYLLWITVPLLAIYAWFFRRNNIEG